MFLHTSNSTCSTASIRLHFHATPIQLIRTEILMYLNTLGPIIPNIHMSTSSKGSKISEIWKEN